jgi:hypothetical protein
VVAGGADHDYIICICFMCEVSVTKYIFDVMLACVMRCVADKDKRPKAAGIVYLLTQDC